MSYGRLGYNNEVSRVNSSGAQTGKRDYIKYLFYYYSIPFRIGYVYGEESRFSVKTGLQYSFLSNAGYKSTIEEADHDLMVDPADRDVSLFFEAGYHYLLKENILISILTSYQKGLSGVSSNDFFPEDDLFHKNIQLSLGISYKISN